jgi:hypothetical protein
MTLEGSHIRNASGVGAGCVGVLFFAHCHINNRWMTCVAVYA